MERTLVAFTITLLATAPAHASHPPQPLAAPGHARAGDIVLSRGATSATATSATRAAATPGPRGFLLARQLLPAPPSPFPSDGGAASSSDDRSSSHRGDPRARSRTIYLNRDGALLRPGANDARLSTSSIVQQPTRVSAWQIDDAAWDETVACVRDLFARFDVSITDRDPGDTPHLEAVFGGHPSEVGLPDSVAGISPFTTNCSTIENSVVFTFTDVLPDDPRVVCEVMAQEIAHSYGLDHELLASDPMTYLDYDGERAFQDRTAACGEDEPRPCGIDTHVCWQQQNSVALLTSRLGRRGSGAPDAAGTTTTPEPELAGCQATGAGAGSAGGPLLLAAAALAGALRSRCSRRSRSARCR